MERWNEINFILSEKVGSDTSEAVFEKHVIEALRIMGWSEFQGDLKVRPSFNIGAANRICPDVVVGSGEQNLFVIEIKQPGVTLTHRHTEQLKSYLRFLKVEIGILIGEKIQLVYDGPLTENYNILIVEEIDFERNNSKGLNFIELFSKSGFDSSKIDNLVKNKVLENQDIKKIKKLKEEILSEDYIQELKALIKKDFQEAFEDRIINKALSQITITINNKVLPQIRKETESKMINKISHPETNHQNGILNRDIPIGLYVRTTFKEIANNLDRTELYNLQKEEYSISTFHIRYPFLRKAKPSDIGKPHRYWKEQVHILGDLYYICSEWYESPQNNDRPHYERWLSRMRNNRSVE